MLHRYPREVAEGVFALGGWWGALAYLAVGTETLLIDTGVARVAGAIQRAIQTTGVRPAAIDQIVLTHYDYDHSGSAAQLARDLDAPVVIHEADAALVASPSESPGLRRLLYHQPVPQVLRWESPEIAMTLREGDYGGRLAGDAHAGSHAGKHEPGARRRGDRGGCAGVHARPVASECAASLNRHGGAGSINATAGRHGTTDGAPWPLCAMYQAGCYGRVAAAAGVVGREC